MLNIVLAGKPSLIEELWEYFVDKYFSPELPYMENISFGTGTLLSLRWIIIGIAIGIIFAAACSFYNKRYIGNFIRKLIKTETLDAERAKTLDCPAKMYRKRQNEGEGELAILADFSNPEKVF